MKKVNILCEVPIEVSRKCLLYVDYNSTLKLRYVSKTWKQIIAKENYWLKRCIVDKILDTDHPNETRISKKFMGNPCIPLYYERLWIYKYLLIRNWVTKPIAQIRKPHFRDNDNECMFYHDEHVIILNHAIHKYYKVFNADTKLIDKFSVNCDFPGVLRNNNLIVIYCGERHIVVRDIKNRLWLWKRDFAEVAQSYGGMYGMNLAVYGDLMAASIKHIALITFIDIFTGNIKYSIIVPHSCRLISLYDIHLFTFTSKGCLNVYNVKNGTLEARHQFDKNNFRRISYIEIEGSYLFISNRRRRMMCICDINKRRNVQRFPSRNYVTFKNSKLVYLESNHCVKIRDYMNNANVITTINTPERILQVRANNNFLVVAHLNDIVVYDFFTGEVKRSISLYELFGVRHQTGIAMHITDTKLIVGISTGEFHEVSYSCVLDFDTTF